MAVWPLSGHNLHVSEFDVALGLAVSPSPYEPLSSPETCLVSGLGSSGVCASSGGLPLGLGVSFMVFSLLLVLYLLVFPIEN